MPARILLIEDHQLLTDGFKLLLHRRDDFVLVGNAYDTDTGWGMVEDLRPDLVVMDLDVPGEGGAALTVRIREKHPQIKVLVITGHTETEYVQQALDAGANGYVLKANAFEVVLDAMTMVLAGKTFLCSETSAIVVREMQQRVRSPKPLPPSLSPREIEVLTHIADGGSTKEIASKLGLSTKTIESHRMNLMTKLEMGSVAELTKYAVRQGLSSL